MASSPEFQEHPGTYETESARGLSKVPRVVKKVPVTCFMDTINFPDHRKKPIKIKFFFDEKNWEIFWSAQIFDLEIFIM